jgi:hypothetical protein
MDRSVSGCTKVAGFCGHGNEHLVFLNCRECNNYLRFSRRSLIGGVEYFYILIILLETH